MAIKAHVKRGSLTMSAAYILITGTRMEKFLLPVTKEDGSFSHNVPAVRYAAQITIYASEEDRQDNFGQALFSRWFEFQHEQGKDPVAEAYMALMKEGIPQWELTNMVEV